MSTPDISIVVCTRNRAASLHHMLASVGESSPSTDMGVELLVVDNGSSDETRQVAEAARLRSIAVRYLHEPVPGLSRARNRATREGRGSVFVFIDDDVRVGPGWLSAMTAPLLDRVADAVAGGVELAPELTRPWMTGLHRSMLAEFGPHDYAWNGGAFVGANMAIGAWVFEAIGGFDEELGAGASLGTGEDAFFARRMKAEDLRIADRTDAMVRHHCDPERLGRASFLRAAEARGRYHAWTFHHWEHGDLPLIRLRALRLGLLRQVARWRAGSPAESGAPITGHELMAIQRWAFARHLTVLRSHPRLYDAQAPRRRAPFLR